jgi:hypothetical protein
VGEMKIIDVVDDLFSVKEVETFENIFIRRATILIDTIYSGDENNEKKIA